MVTQQSWAQPMAVGPQRVSWSPGLAIGHRLPWRTPHSALMRMSSSALVIRRYVALTPHDQAWLIMVWKPRIASS